MFSIKIFPSRPKHLEHARLHFSHEMKEALLEAGDMLREEAASEAPVKTGALRRSLEFVVKKLQQGWALFVGSGVKSGRYVPYARIQDIGGNTGRNGSVHISGNRYLTGTIERRKQAVDHIIDKHIRRLFR